MTSVDDTSLLNFFLSLGFNAEVNQIFISQSDIPKIWYRTVWHTLLRPRLDNLVHIVMCHGTDNTRGRICCHIKVNSLTPRLTATPATNRPQHTLSACVVAGAREGMWAYRRLRLDGGSRTWCPLVFHQTMHSQLGINLSSFRLAYWLNAERK